MLRRRSSAQHDFNNTHQSGRPLNHREFLDLSGSGSIAGLVNAVIKACTIKLVSPSENIVDLLPIAEA